LEATAEFSPVGFDLSKGVIARLILAPVPVDRGRRERGPDLPVFAGGLESMGSQSLRRIMRK
jgi:hypothetical protein